ncbi:MAG: hypothetical protein ACK54L_03280, partial [Betaproteobacteria bacterium]
YEVFFWGVLELRLSDQPHHLHIDFGRVHKLAYVVAPSVCLAFKPSFELRFLMIGPGGAPTDRWAVSLMLAEPYAQGTLDRDAALEFFQRARHDAALRPDLVEFVVDPAVRAGGLAPQILAVLQAATGQVPGTPWPEAVAALCPMSSAPTSEDQPLCLPVLQQALLLRDAS